VKLDTATALCAVGATVVVTSNVRELWKAGVLSQNCDSHTIVISLSREENLMTSRIGCISTRNKKSAEMQNYSTYLMVLLADNAAAIRSLRNGT
jgi:hypothetical protein